jgi:hypothetical protein
VIPGAMLMRALAAVLLPATGRWRKPQSAPPHGTNIYPRHGADVLRHLPLMLAAAHAEPFR